MNWDQIENKWAAMARRVRADWPGTVQDSASQPAQMNEDRKITQPNMGALADTQPGEAKAAAIE